MHHTHTHTHTYTAYAERFPFPINYQPVKFIEPPFWCSVAYYEVKNRVEEHFLASELSFTIDGFTHTSSSDRYCLGMFSNIQRTEAHR